MSVKATTAKATTVKATTTPTRMTKQRRAILDVLAQGDFRSAQAWHERLKDGGSPIGLATVYRALQALAESGDVDSVVAESGEVLYRQCDAGEDHHHHLRCRTCGAAVELEVPQFEAFARSVAQAHGYGAIHHTIELTGICPSCSGAR